MKKKIMLAASVLALTAGSIFAAGQRSAETPLKSETEQCPPDCCNGGDCGPESCSDSNQ